MPYKSKKACKYAGCPNLTDGSYCDIHKKERHKQYNKTRNQSVEKLYKTDVWQRLRLNHLRLFPYCAKCNSIHDLHIHHINSHHGDPDKFFDQNNLETLCRSCHSSLHLRNYNNEKK